MGFIFFDTFWFVLMLFGSMVKFFSLAQFPVDHSSKQVEPSFVLLLYKFAAFTYVINRFISVST